MTARSSVLCGWDAGVAGTPAVTADGLRPLVRRFGRPADSTADRCPDPLEGSCRLKRLPRRMGLAVVVGAVGLAVALLPAPALAQAADPTQTLSAVINRIQTLIIGLAAGLATLFLTWAGIRYMLAGGDPGQMEKAKTALRSAAIGYGVAALAPALFALLRYVIGV
jgi:hypothetical protein